MFSLNSTILRDVTSLMLPDNLEFRKILLQLIEFYKILVEDVVLQVMLRFYIVDVGMGKKSWNDIENPFFTRYG